MRDFGTDINVGRRDFEADRKLCEAATKGNYVVSRRCLDALKVEIIVADYQDKAEWTSPTEHDAKFIYSAREGWPAALDEIERLNKAFVAKINQQTKMYGEYGETISQLMQENARLRTALHDAINRPMGVVPDSAVEFYDQDKGRE